MGAAIRSGWGGGASRRRQAHEQGPAACGVGDGRFPKRDSQGIDPLSGCGQSPPFSPRDGCVGAAASWSAGRYASSFWRACQTVLEGQTVSSSIFAPRQTKIRRANSEALLPRRGKQRRSRTPAAYPCPAGQGCVIPPNLPFRIGGLFPAQPRRRERQKKAQTSPFQKGRKSSSALAPSTPSNSNRSAPRPRGCGHRAPVRRISLY